MNTKKCVDCGTIEDLCIDRNYIRNLCITCRCKRKKEYRQNKKCCFKCGTKENLVKRGKIICPSCEKHYEEYRENINNKNKSTCLKNYGVENVANSFIVKEKRKQTFLKNYGVESPFKSKKILDKAHKTKKERYGNETFTNPEKKRKTCIEKYGDAHYNNREKFVKTNNERYNVDYPAQNPYIIAKNAKAYKIKKYKDTDITYQSKPEYMFIKKCVNNNIEIENGDRIPYYFDNMDRYYFCDFKIKVNNKWQLVEIKMRHKWYYKELISGKLLAKAKAALVYSKLNGYLPYKMIIYQ